MFNNYYCCDIPRPTRCMDFSYFPIPKGYFCKAVVRLNGEKSSFGAIFFEYIEKKQYLCMLICVHDCE